MNAVLGERKEPMMLEADITLRDWLWSPGMLHAGADCLWMKQSCEDLSTKEHTVRSCSMRPAGGDGGIQVTEVWGEGQASRRFFSGQGGKWQACDYGER